jgi:hypothetical protein
MTTRGAPAEVSFLILTYWPFVSSAVAKKVTRSPVTVFLDGARQILRRHGFLLAFASKPCVCRPSMTSTTSASDREAS